MDYTSLIASKGTPGSILNWVGYSKLDAPTLLEDSQTLLYQFLRVREMRKEWVFGVSVGQCSVDLPARFLDPIDKIRDATNNLSYDHLGEGKLKTRRVFDTIDVAVALGASPFTTVNGSGLVTVNKTAHGISQDSILTFTGAAAVNGITPNGTFPVDSVTDANNFVIDTGGSANASGSGGGSGASYTGANLVSGSPMAWAIWDEAVKFDFAFDTAAVMGMLYYQQPALLSASNTTNFLTVKYPRLLRAAAMVSAAEFMDDTENYNNNLQALQALIAKTAQTDDFGYRGASFGTENP